MGLLYFCYLRSQLLVITKEVIILWLKQSRVQLNLNYTSVECNLKHFGFCFCRKEVL